MVKSHIGKGKGNSVPLQAWSGPEGSRKLRFPDYMTTAQVGGKVNQKAPAAFTPRKCSSWYSFLKNYTGKWISQRSLIGNHLFYVIGLILRNVFWCVNVGSTLPDV